VTALEGIGFDEQIGERDAVPIACEGGVAKKSQNSAALLCRTAKADGYLSIPNYFGNSSMHCFYCRRATYSNLGGKGVEQWPIRPVMRALAGCLFADLWSDWLSPLS
jgi:hypothetical protein